MTSSLVGLASNAFQVSKYFGSSYAIAGNNSAGERTGQNSWNITSGLCGHADLSFRYGYRKSTPLRMFRPSGVVNVQRLSSLVERMWQIVAIASRLKIE